MLVALLHRSVLAALVLSCCVCWAQVMVRYLGGIPQVLLDFAKEINAKVGPMEEQRVTWVDPRT